MGVCLYFTTEEPVEPATAAAVREACRQVKAAGRHWVLCEPPWFFPDDSRGDVRLRGRTKLFVMPYQEDLAESGPIDRLDHDLGRILDALCRWSGEYGLTWRLEIDGHKIGWVENGECEPRVRDLVNSMAAEAAELGEAGRLESRHPPNAPEEKPNLRIWRG